MPTIVFLLILLAATLHALWNFATKKVAGDMAVIWLGLVMACLVFLPLVFFISPDQMAFKQVYPYIIISGIFNTIYFFALAKAYEYGEISVVYPIARGNGIAGTALIAFLFLREEISLLGAVGIIIISIGILLLGLKDGYHKHSVLLALLVGAMIVGYSLTDKLAVDISHPFFYNFAITVLFTLLLAPYVLAKKRPELKDAWQTKKKYSLVIGLGTALSYLIILFMFQLAQVSYIVATREFAVVIGAILGFVFLKEQFTARKAFGIAAITVGMILIKMS